MKANFYGIGVLLLSGLMPIQETHAQNKWQEMGEFIESEMEKWHVPNVSIGIVNKDSVLFQREFGGKEANENYLIGSVSKPFTALAIMQLYEQGALDIDQTVNHYLPWFNIGDESLSGKITVRHLLNQTGGLPKSAGFFIPKNNVKYEYSRYLRSLEIDKEAIGKTHIYCNLNYQILGELIQEISGLSYNQYLKKNIFGPVGMENSYASYEETIQTGLKSGYQYLFGYPTKRSFFYSDAGIASGDIASNVTDMNKFLMTMLNAGISERDTIISSDILKEMHIPVSNRYGMGFSIGDWNGLHSIRHSGLSKNYSSAINILPDKNYAIVILTNINSFHFVSRLMDGVIRRLNDQEIAHYSPFELYFRYVVLALLIWGAIDLVRKVVKWKEQQFQMSFSRNYKKVIKLLLSSSIALLWLFVVPRLADLPLSRILLFQPDLGYGLIACVFLSVTSAAIKYLVVSNNEKESSANGPPGNQES